MQVDKFTSLQVDELLVILYANRCSFVTVSFMQVDELTSLQVDELLVMLLAYLVLLLLCLSCKFTSLQVYK